MDEATDPIALARVGFHQVQDQYFAGSALADIGTWVQTGAPPPAKQLRDAGYVHNAPRDVKGLVQKSYNRTWGFALPCREAIQALIALSPVVEIGAGTGFWSAMARAAGADIIPTDILSEGTPGYGMTNGAHCQVIPLDARSAVLAYADSNVFCSWPTRDAEWCADAVREIRPGRSFALIGRPRGGTTGSGSLFDLLDQDFTLVDRIEIPQFPSEDDDLRIYLRR